MAEGLARRLVAEAIGTFFLLAAIVGSGIMGETLANGQAAAVLLPHALAIGAVLVVFVTVFGPVSGAHFNPAVTLAFWLRGEIGGRPALAYAAVQTAAALAGVVAAHTMFGLALVQVSLTPRSTGGLWLAEAIATFGLVLVILAGIAVNRAAVPWLVGLYIGAALWFTASTSFANPAVTVARAFTDTFSGIAPAHVPAFLLAQAAGSVAALPVARFLWPAPAGGPHTDPRASGLPAAAPGATPMP